jgi:tRNA-Thr(GGU) m(6)t(6)A37 methyltransferase TsaA
MKIIARIRTDYKEKFGIPRQSLIGGDREARIVFEPEYRVREAFTGLEGYSHIWLIWQFSKAVRDTWSPTVRPPRLGGNRRMGVFATRSPFRPNPIGLSSVRLLRIDYSAPDGPCLVVSGADLLDGTPIYDIKPYLAFTDSHPDAVCGFAAEVRDYSVRVILPDSVADGIPERDIAAIREILEQDPRPSYKKDSDKEYAFLFADYEVFFKREEDALTVTRIDKITCSGK